LQKKAEAPDHQLLQQLHGFEHGNVETCEARDFGSYPESFSLQAGLLAFPVFANLPIPERDSGYFRQNLLTDKGLQLRGQLLNRTGFPLSSERTETGNTIAMIQRKTN
jgi:hypothetical protein